MEPIINSKTVELEAIYDCITGRRKHFTIGCLGTSISGGLYIKNGDKVPDQIIITFEKGKKKDAANKAIV